MPGSIVFHEGTAGPAKVDYSVPMPGTHFGRRIVRLDLGIKDTEWDADALTFGKQPGEAAGITQQGAEISIDVATARIYLRDKLTAAGFRSDDVDLALTRLHEVVNGSAQPAPRRRLRSLVADASLELATDFAVTTTPPPPPPPPPEPTPADRLDEIIDTFVENARRGVVTNIAVDSTGDVVLEPRPITVAVEPNLFLVEKYAISSFLGDYGMGRTVRTFTLLPGESTSIRIKTWQSTEQSRKQASSIIDSHEHAAETRFQSEVQKETTDKKTRSSEEKWSVEAEASASWGWGSAKVSGSASGEYHSGREQFSKQTSSAVGEHAAKASSKRELSVTSESETTTTTGEESIVERTISNANVRRVLNFVFRELNQEYTTKLHLVDVQVAFTNLRTDSWHVVPMSGLRQLLDDVIDATPARRNKLASLILKIAAVVMNHASEPVHVLETVHHDPLTEQFDVDPISFDSDGLPEPPTQERHYRFKAGPLGQDAEDPDARPLVDGVLMSDQTVVMRTDSVIVEALLGESDALDDFAMEVQRAAATKQTLANQREQLLQDTVAAIGDPAQRAELAAALFRPATDDQS